MKAALVLVAGLALEVLSNAPADAGPLYVRCYTSGNTVGVTYPSTGGPCPKIASSHAECMKVGIERGWDANSMGWACFTQAYKN